MPFNWQKKAQEASDRLDQESSRGVVEGQEPHQQKPAAAEGGGSSNVGVTPVTSAPTEATAVNSPRSWLGGIASWWTGESTKNDTPTMQAQTEAPKHNAGDEGMDPGLRATSALAIFSSQDNVRSRLVPNIRANL